jgi:hypothetical protein
MQDKTTRLATSVGTGPEENGIDKDKHHCMSNDQSQLLENPSKKLSPSFT